MLFAFCIFIILRNLTSLKRLIYCYLNLVECLFTICIAYLSLILNNGVTIYFWRGFIVFCVCFLAFDICRFCMVIRFFHPRHNGQWSPTSKDFYPRFYPFHFLTILILEKEPVFPLFNVQCQTRELLVPFLERLWYVAVLDWGLNPGPPAPDASTLPLGYRGGGTFEEWSLSCCMF